MSSKEIQDKVKKIIAEKLSVDLAEVKPKHLSWTTWEPIPWISSS